MHEWNIQKFSRVPQRYWNEPSNQKLFLKDLMNMLTSMGLPYTNLTRDLVVRHGGRTLLKKFKSLSTLLQVHYPEGGIIPRRVFFGQRTQRYLAGLVKSLFTEELVDTNFKHVDLRFDNTSRIL